MLKQRMFLAAAVAVIGLAHSDATKAEQTETFNTAASSAANGWTVIVDGTPETAESAGFINENLAGGAGPGEAKYHPFRDVPIAYVDTNLGMTISGNTVGGFSMTGVLSNLGGLQPDPQNPVVLSGDVGLPPILGFGSSAKEQIGIYFRGDDPGQIDPAGDGSEVAWGIRFVRDLGGDFGDIIFGAGGTDASRILVEGTSYPFSLVFDPTMGEFGTFTAEVVGAGAAIPFALSQSERDHLNAVAFNRAGLQKLGRPANPTSNFELRLDDLTYTGVAGTPVGVPGDYNNNGKVDAADYVIWRNGGPLLNEVDTPGTVNAADYTEWRARFGNPPGSGAGASTAVPEPASYTLFIAAAIVLLLNRRC